MTRFPRFLVTINNRYQERTSGWPSMRNQTSAAESPLWPERSRDALHGGK